VHGRGVQVFEQIEKCVPIQKRLTNTDVDHTTSEAFQASQWLCNIQIRYQNWNVTSVRELDFTAQMVWW